MVLRTIWKPVTEVCEELAICNYVDGTARFIADKIGRPDHEEFWVLMLNAKNRVVWAEMVSRGGLFNTCCSPREIFAPAVVNKAAAIIVAHNHPSADCTPSREDINMYKQLVKAGKILGIPVLDGFIVSIDNYYSFRQNGLIK